MPSLRDAEQRLINQCAMWCTAKRLEPTSDLMATGMARIALADYLVLGKGFGELNETQRRAVAGVCG